MRTSPFLFPPKGIYKYSLCEHPKKSVVISITDKALKVTLYDEKGDEQGHVFELAPKRNATINTVKDSVLLNSLTLEYDKENSDADLTWKAFYYGNVERVLVEHYKDYNDVQVTSMLLIGETLWVRDEVKGHFTFNSFSS